MIPVFLCLKGLNKAFLLVVLYQGGESGCSSVCFCFDLVSRKMSSLVEV